MAAISFKSAGRLKKDVETLRQANVEVNRHAIGFKTPMRFAGQGEGLFAKHTALDDQINDNLRNLILTNWGERLGLYDFGANLKEITTELVASDAFEAEAMRRIRDATSRWMPFVQLESFEYDFDRVDNDVVAKVLIRLTYTVPRINTARRKLEIILHVI